MNRSTDDPREPEVPSVEDAARAKYPDEFHVGQRERERDGFKAGAAWQRSRLLEPEVVERMAKRRMHVVYRSADRDDACTCAPNERALEAMRAAIAAVCAEVERAAEMLREREQ
jgi:hypothetical protein